MNDRPYQKRFSEQYGFWFVWGLTLSAIHLFIYLRLRIAFDRWAPSLAWLSFSLFMMCVQFLLRKKKVRLSGSRRRLVDRVCGVWTIFVLISFVVLIILDLLKHIAAIGLSEGECLLLSFILSAVLVVLGIKQAHTVQTTVIKVPTSKLPEGCDRIRIVQLTDLHLGPFTGIPLLAQILRKVRRAEPDIVVVTGDLTDGRIKGRKREIAMFRRIKPRFGMYAVTGNHDYYDDINDAVAFMEACGMKVLRTECVEAGGILIAGVDDKDHLIKERWNLSRSETLVLSYEREQKDKFLLLLRHRPIVEAGTEGHFDLQLSGHTHGGQVFPLISSRHRVAGHSRGLKKLKCGGMLYVCNGAGFVGPPVRIMAPPEIAVFDIVRDEAAQPRN